eukprot:7215273-Pyramimonas_sp.AAC.1
MLGPPPWRAEGAAPEAPPGAPSADPRNPRGPPRTTATESPTTGGQLLGGGTPERHPRQDDSQECWRPGVPSDGFSVAVV